jgi:GNAT superfamily N-acetyltransferase
MVSVRAAMPADVPRIYEMLCASAHDQGFPDEMAVTEQDLLEDGFGPAPRFFALIAEVSGAAAGLALYFFNYSTWGSRLGLYLEDLYVSREHRRAGVARALLARLAEIAKAEGCGRFQWMVHRGNERAIRFYESFGAVAAPDWIMMNLKIAP